MAAPSFIPRTQRWFPLILSAAMAGSFALFAALAAIRFPEGYGPWHGNTLSELGNPNLNPDGYVLYLIGCAVAGLCATAFFINLGRWHVSGTRGQNRLLLLLQLVGMIGGLGLFLNAIFPESQYVPHHIVAGLAFNCFAAAALIAIPALWRAGLWNLALIGLDIVGFIGVILMFVFSSVHWVEWVPVGMFILFPFLLTVLSRVLKQAP